MNWRKVIGWFLVIIGIPLFVLLAALSKELTGNYALGAFIGIMIIGAGIMLDRSKKKK